MTKPDIQLFIEAHETWLARSIDYVEFLQYWFERHLELSEFARVMKSVTAGSDSIPAIPATNDVALLNRFQALTKGRHDLFFAAVEYTAPLLRNLKITEKCGGSRYGELIVWTLNLLDSFFWPGRRQWRHDKFRDSCLRQQNLLDALRRDYL